MNHSELSRRSFFGIDIHGLDKKANDEKAAGQHFGATFRPFEIPLRACRAKDEAP